MPAETIGSCPFDERFTQDPYATYVELRRDAPVHRAVLPDGLPVWLVTSYADVRAALTHPALVKDIKVADEVISRQTGKPGGEEVGRFSVHMLNADPPHHTRLRKLVNKAFTTRRVEGLRPRIEQVAGSLAAAIATRGEADLIEDFAVPLPVFVICELLGFPIEDHKDFRLWMDAFVSNAVERETARAVEEMTGYLLRRIADKRKSPGDDLLSGLIQARDDDAGRFSEQELVSMAFLLLLTGHETTVNLIGNGMLTLLLHPHQLDQIRADLTRLPAAIEELLRYDSPINTATLRFTVEDVELGGTTIPAGEVVLAALGSANRDSAQFPKPDRFDIARDASGHVAFGHGVHYCLGASLARLQGRIAFETLIRRLPRPRLAVDPGQLRWRPSIFVRGLSQLPVRFDPDETRAGKPHG